MWRDYEIEVPRIEQSQSVKLTTNQGLSLFFPCANAAAAKLKVRFLRSKTSSDARMIFNICRANHFLRSCHPPVGVEDHNVRSEITPAKFQRQFLFQPGHRPV